MRNMPAIKPALVAKLFLLAGTALMLAGCTRGMSDLRDWVAQEKAKRGAPIPPLPVIKTFETFTYTDQDKRDPFSPSPDELNQNNGPRPDEGRARQPLEAYSLDSLRMVGTIGMGANIQALIKDPGGVIHRVQKNEYMGQNYGHITAISSDRVDLVELVSNGNGGWMERPASIALVADAK
ncbi:pilus assembly protein PilP [Dyella acidiphila]|uniref:Pilus assembly protein PilP n=1 Tax=Dyella acidiphila TaxID=2775866 RepID=A0ABR9G4K0_9GAMM|nr:pilus assembly protein PilP [Dyella acidiphila]MBE1158938.1 pilus assembly protein PilP [Dyella acidiphila]